MIDIGKLRNDIKRYTDSDGLIHVYPVGSGEVGGDGNCLLYTGFYYCILRAHGALTQVDEDAIKKIILACQHRDYPLLWRSPYKKNKDDHQSADDYWTALPMASFGYQFFARQYLSHMRQYYWSADMQNPEKFSFRFLFARYAGFIALAKASANERINLIDALGVAFNIWFDKKSPDSFMKLYGLCIVLKGQSQMVDTLWKRYLSNIDSKKLLAEFFNHEGWGEHPLCVEL